jgi:four helix bundle protein
MIESYRDLRVYKIAYQLALEVHQISRKFPDFEKYELGSQIRRAAISIPLNIAEGYGKRSSTAEFKRFLQMAQGSKEETKVLLEIVKDLGYIQEEEYINLFNKYDEFGKQLYRLHENWE